VQAGTSLPRALPVTWQAKQPSVPPFFHSIKMMTLLTVVKTASMNSISFKIYLYGIVR